jgi:hypothetical protein
MNRDNLQPLRQRTAGSQEVAMTGDIRRFALSSGAAILLLLLATWAFGGFEGLSAVGVFSLLIGVIVAVAGGVGLMALVFYSDRSERDEAVYHLRQDRRDR